MNILVAGASGFIGRHLLKDLAQRGHQATAMVRNAEQQGVFWSPTEGRVDDAALRNAQPDVVINLAGESVAERWSQQKKHAIHASRVAATQLLVRHLLKLEKKPMLLLCASAIGFYGERGKEVLTEDSAPGDTFLSRVCIEWEQATQPAASAGIRVANLRFGIVLSTTGGALPRMLIPFQLGAGGQLGTGQQYMSWITIDDALSAIRFIIDRTELNGPVNIVAPNPVTNQEFTQILGKTMRVPTLVPVPVAMARCPCPQEPRS